MCHVWLRSGGPSLHMCLSVMTTGPGLLEGPTAACCLSLMEFAPGCGNALGLLCWGAPPLQTPLLFVQELNGSLVLLVGALLAVGGRLEWRRATWHTSARCAPGSPQLMAACETCDCCQNTEWLSLATWFGWSNCSFTSVLLLMNCVTADVSGLVVTRYAWRVMYV